MARFDVRRVRDSDVLALELQTDLLDGLNTRLVAPLVPRSDIGPFVERLNPAFEIEQTTYVMMTQHMAAVPVHELADTICNLSNHREAITSATGFLFQGF